MRFVIEDGAFAYTVDWTKLNSVEKGWENEYNPTPKECIEALLRLLGSVIPPEKISDALAEGVESMEYSEAGWKALDKLKGNK